MRCRTWQTGARARTFDVAQSRKFDLQGIGQPLQMKGAEGIEPIFAPWRPIRNRRKPVCAVGCNPALPRASLPGAPLFRQ